MDAKPPRLEFLAAEYELIAQNGCYPGAVTPIVMPGVKGPQRGHVISGRIVQASRR
jgi:hypothetical protein